MLALFGLAIVCLSVTADHAEARNCYWLADTPQNSGTAAAWNGGIAPTTGDNWFLSSNHTGTCTINQTNVFGSITMTGPSGGIITASVNVRFTGTFNDAYWNYKTGIYTLTTGPIILGTSAILEQTGTNGNIICTSYTQSGTGSVLTGKVDAYFNLLGNFTKTAGTIPVYTMRLVVLANATINLNVETYLYSFDTAVGVTAISSGTSSFLVPYFNNQGTWTVKLTSSVLLMDTGFSTGIGSYANTGIINGTGPLQIFVKTYNPSITLGIVRCPIQFINDNGATGNRIISLSVDTALSNTVSVSSADATYTMTLNPAGHSLSATGLITASTRGIITSSVPGASIIAGNGLIVASTGVLNITNIKTVSVSTSWDTSAGTFISDSASVILTGTGTTKLSAGQSFYNLDTTTTAVRTLQSNIWTRNHLGLNGTTIQGSFYNNVSSNIAIPLNLDSSTFGSVYLNGTAATYQVNFVTSMNGYVYSKATVTYHGTSGNIVTYSIGGNYIGTKVQLQTFPTKYQYSISYPAVSQVMLFQVSGLKTLTIYNVSFNGVNVTQIQSDASGIGSYTLPGPWSLAGSTVVLYQFVPAVVPAVVGPDYTGIAMVLLFLGLVTLFNLLGYIIRVRVIMLIAVCILLPGVVWAFVTIPTYSLIPLLFVIVNVVLFVMDLVGGRKK